MILLDTDHLSILAYRDNPRCGSLQAKLRYADDLAIAITAITVEEQVRGWLGKIRGEKQRRNLVGLYDRFLANFAFLAGWPQVRFDEAALAGFERLIKEKVRVGAQDLKIAAIVLARDALLLSANLRDFQKVPGLRVENWLS